MSGELDSLFSCASAEPPVKVSSDLERVLNLPQRDAEALSVRVAEPLTQMLRAPGGSMALRPLQALALIEAHDLRGLLALLPVGEGKTLITYLLPVVLDWVKRPILVGPAALAAKTSREFEALRAHWQAPKVPYPFVSYELISTRPGLLQALQPDLIVCDESNALKNPKAACTKRMYRYLRGHQDTVFCALSGTIADRSFLDWWHVQQWALPALCQPLPYSYPVVQSWAQALDAKLPNPRPVGDLAALVDDGSEPTADNVRLAFGRRLRATPGVIAASGRTVGAGLRIEQRDLRVPVIDDALAAMRRTWCTPGGEEFSEAADLWRHARELANGFYYVWDPQPPDWWLDPRREFNSFVRGVLRGSRTLDTMAQVAAAHGDAKAVQDWRAVEHSFKPNTVATWLTDTVLEYAIEHATRHNSLVWVEHTAVGARLEALGLPYHGEGGLDSYGQNIESKDGRPAAVSALAVYRGFNLQAWHDNLILNATPKGARYEQLIGRTHRYGQLADCVSVTLVYAAEEQRAGFAQAREDARYIEQTTGQAQKLCYADYV